MRVVPGVRRLLFATAMLDVGDHNGWRVLVGHGCVGVDRCDVFGLRCPASPVFVLVLVACV